MRKDLDDLLCERYPKIFAERHGLATETGMCWGFQCGDGWFNLIDTLCEQLQVQTDHCGAPQVVVQEIKEKMGKLRFYSSGYGSDVQRGMIKLAQELSARTCELCGHPGELDRSQGWVVTRCEDHWRTAIHALE